MTYRINKKPKRKSMDRPRSRDSIRLETKRDDELFHQFVGLAKVIMGKYRYVTAEVKKTGHTTDELTEELTRLHDRAKAREDELNCDHLIHEGSNSQVWKDNDLLLKAWDSILSDIKITEKEKWKSDPKIKRPLILLGKPTTIRIDRAGRKARKTCQELILEAIDIANSFIKSGNNSEFNNYLFRLLTIRNMSRDETMEKIRMLEVQEAIYEIPTADNCEVASKGKCYIHVKEYKKYVVYQED